MEDDDEDSSAADQNRSLALMRLVRQVIDYSESGGGPKMADLNSDPLEADTHARLSSPTTTSSTWSLLLSALFYSAPQDKFDLDWSNIILAIILILLMLTTAIGNLFVIVAILIERNLRTIGNYLVLSLAIADLLVACLVMPLAGIYQILDRWTLGVLLCDIWTSADVFCCTASILHLLAIALDRYWAVTRVDYIRCQRNERRILFMIAFVWMAACVISLAPVFGWKDDNFEWRITNDFECLISQDIGYQIFATCTTFYCPLILTLIFYWKIYQVARKRIRRKPGNRVKVALQHPSTSSSNSSPSSKHQQPMNVSINNSGTKSNKQFQLMIGDQCKSSLVAERPPTNLLSDFKCSCDCHRIATASVGETAAKANKESPVMMKEEKRIQELGSDCAKQYGQSNNETIRPANEERGDNDDGRHPETAAGATAAGQVLAPTDNSATTTISATQPLYWNSASSMPAGDGPMIGRSVGTAIASVADDHRNQGAPFVAGTDKDDCQRQLSLSLSSAPAKPHDDDTTKNAAPTASKTTDQQPAAGETCAAPNAGELDTANASSSSLPASNDCLHCRRCHWSSSRNAMGAQSGCKRTNCGEMTTTNNSLSSSDARSDSTASCSPVSSIVNCIHINAGYSTPIITNNTATMYGNRQLGSSSVIATNTAVGSNLSAAAAADKRSAGENAELTNSDCAELLLDDCCPCCCELQSVKSKTSTSHCNSNRHSLPANQSDLVAPRRAADEDGEHETTAELTQQQRAARFNNTTAHMSQMSLEGDSSTGDMLVVSAAGDIHRSEPDGCDYRTDTQRKLLVGLQRYFGPSRRFLNQIWLRTRQLLVKEAPQPINGSLRDQSNVKLVQLVNEGGKSTLVKVCSICQCATSRANHPASNPLASHAGRQQVTVKAPTPSTSDHHLMNMGEQAPSTDTGGMFIAASTANIAVQTTVRSVALNHNTQSTTTTISQQQSISEGVESRRERKAAKTLAIITGVFVMCWLPFFIMAITMPLLNLKPHKYVFAVLLWLGYVNSMLNPIIYTIFSPDFRKAFKRLLCGSDESLERRRRIRKQREQRKQQLAALDTHDDLESGCWHQFQQQVLTVPSVLASCWSQCLTCNWDLWELSQAASESRARHRESRATSRQSARNIQTASSTSQQKGSRLLPFKPAADGEKPLVSNLGNFTSTSNEVSRYTLESTTTSDSPKTIPSSTLASNNGNQPGPAKGLIRQAATSQMPCVTTSGRPLIMNDF